MNELKEFARWCIGLLLLWTAIIAVFQVLPVGRDDSDPGQWGKRSGMSPRIDALTGCQYLEGSRGGITPRLGRDGKHVCGM